MLGKVNYCSLFPANALVGLVRIKLRLAKDGKTGMLPDNLRQGLEWLIGHFKNAGPRVIQVLAQGLLC